GAGAVARHSNGTRPLSSPSLRASFLPTLWVWPALCSPQGMLASTLPKSPEEPGTPQPEPQPPQPEPPLPGTPPTVPPDTTPSPKPVPGGVPPTGPSNVRRASAARLSGRTVSPRVAFPTTTWSERRTPMRRALFHSFVALVIAIGAAACANTARGVVEDTQENAAA